MTLGLDRGHALGLALSIAAAGYAGNDSDIHRCSDQTGLSADDFGQPGLQPVGGGEAAVGVAGAMVGGAVAVDHLAGPPAGEAHEVALVAAGREPL